MFIFISSSNRNVNTSTFNYIQAPSQIGSLFNGRRVTAYAFIPNCQQAYLKAKINGHELSTIVTCPDLLISRGDNNDLLHKLTAKSLIDDWQYGILCQDDAVNNKIENDLRKLRLKEKIIRLSVKYSITSEYTSFLAIEDRDQNNKVNTCTTVDVHDLLSLDKLDILSYMAYSESDETKVDEAEVSVENLVSQIDQSTMSDEERDRLFEVLLKNKSLLSSSSSANTVLRLKCSLLLANEYKRKGEYLKASVECKEAFDASIAELDCFDEDTYRKVTLFLLFCCSFRDPSDDYLLTFFRCLIVFYVCL